MVTNSPTVLFDSDKIECLFSVKTRRRGGTSVDEPDKDGEPDKTDAQGSETGEPSAKKRKEADDVKVETDSPKPAPPTRPQGKIIIQLTINGPIRTAADDSLEYFFSFSEKDKIQNFIW